MILCEGSGGLLSVYEFLKEMTATRGISGDEAPVAKKIAGAFRPLCDEVTVDAMQNVVARLGAQGPRVMIAAHLDEIGLMVSQIEEDGCLRVTSVGGVDPRILPAGRVTVYTQEGPMPGVIGAIAPHLLTAEDRTKNYKMQDLYVDMGLPESRVRQLVHPGTQVALYGPVRALKNGRYASKTVDDRGCVAIMLRAAELLKNTKIGVQALFVATSQEEVGSYGAHTVAWALDPDLGIAIDVTHGEMPGCEPGQTHPLGKVVLSQGPYIDRKLHRRLTELCKKLRIDYETSVAPRNTWTDADDIQIARAGVPTALIELPLKYMHTTVETFCADTLEEAARLLAALLAQLGEEEETP